MRLKLVYNPAAGRGRAGRLVAAAADRLRARGAVVEVAASTSPEDLTRIAAEGSRGGCDRVIVCGGDGSLNLAVREFDLSRGVLGLIPAGSGDDFARVLGIPRKIEEACHIALGENVRSIDVAVANGTRYLGVAGLGFDSEVAEFANTRVKHLRGSAIYLYAIFRVLPRFTPHPVRIRSNGGDRQEVIMFACVGNSRQYGGGIRIVPDAVVDDGLLDYCIVHQTTRGQLLKTLPLAYTGAHVRKPFVETGRGTEFRFDAAQNLLVYADGERISTTPVTFGLVKEKLKIAAP
jgi:diacylglycerol kinase (ATP)